MNVIEVNGRSYRVPERPTVVICFDGCDPAYIGRGFADGILPTIAAFRGTGFYGAAEAVVPTFTNPNNASIVTGVPPAVHGISGNYYLDRATGEERMITDGALMRCGTILAAMARRGREDGGGDGQGQAAPDAGARPGGHRFLLRACRPRRPGRQRHRRCRGHGRPGQARPVFRRPSLYVLDAGLRLLERGRRRLLYLSLSDFVQHAHAPGTPEADAFNRAVDARIAALMALGAVVGVVADHGMNDKSRPTARPTWCSWRRS